MMNELAKNGKRRTLLVSLSVLLVSIHTIYFYHSTVPDVPPSKILQQVLRFILTALLLFLIYQGKKWARVVGIVLFSLGLLGALLSLLTLESLLINKIPFLVMSFVYAIALMFLLFDQSFKAFCAYQKSQ